MFDIDIKVLHLEPTTVCNAKCPQCARENTNLYNDSINQNEISLKKCMEIFDIEFIKNLDKMFMCGTFGDPTAAKDMLDIFKYFRKHNHNITLGVNTNGSIRNTKWWEQLASILNKPNDYVVFSIDGLHDTNHIYRKNVNWKKVMNNASAFINAGGSAHWDMLVFEHNEHQIDDAEILAREMGFSWFRYKISKRFKTNPITNLNPPSNFVLPISNNINKIQCHALMERSIYVSATGEKLPCCWIGSRVFNMDTKMRGFLNSKKWSSLIGSWELNPHKICSESCGISHNGETLFNAQWNKEVNLSL